jgi:hypothetical protein
MMKEILKDEGDSRSWVWKGGRAPSIGPGIVNARVLRSWYRGH